MGHFKQEILDSQEFPPFARQTDFIDFTDFEVVSKSLPVSTKTHTVKLTDWKRVVERVCVI